MIKREIQRNKKNMNFSRTVVNDKKYGNAVLTEMQEDSFIKARDLEDMKVKIKRAIEQNDVATLNLMSNTFYNSRGIYARLCEYFAKLYKYDWYITPIEISAGTQEDFWTVLGILESSHLKKICGEMFLTAIKDGAYFGYVTNVKDKILIQDLPYSYCRSRFTSNGFPVIEFNATFFDDKFTDKTYRTNVLNSFPLEFRKGYEAYKNSSLNSNGPDSSSNSWFSLNPNKSVKISLNKNDSPIFANSFIELISLEEAQILDKQKTMQQLVKILIQKLPLDKNFELVFDQDEAKDLHEGAVQMMRRAIGVDVLTTFADVAVEDMSDGNSSMRQDDLAKIERSLFNALGVSENLFNTDGNLALEKSIATDEALLSTEVNFLESIYTNIINKLIKTETKFSFAFLPTTIFNYKELAALYKEQIQYGYSRILPAVALGTSQFKLLKTIEFEQKVLKLDTLMVPPQSSATVSSSTTKPEVKTPGRPALPDDKKTDKTIQNKSSSD